MAAEICPDCLLPVAMHELYRDGRCPVVRFAGVPVVVDPTIEPGTAELRNDEGCTVARIRGIE